MSDPTIFPHGEPPAAAQPPTVLSEWWAWCNAHPHALDTVAKRPAAVIDELWARCQLAEWQHKEVLDRADALEIELSKLRAVAPAAALSPTSTSVQCERCGGTGQQKAGLYSVFTNRYDSAAGQCDDCLGTGRLWSAALSPTSKDLRAELVMLADKFSAWGRDKSNENKSLLDAWSYVADTLKTLLRKFPASAALSPSEEPLRAFLDFEVELNACTVATFLRYDDAKEWADANGGEVREASAPLSPAAQEPVTFATVTASDHTVASGGMTAAPSGMPDWMATMKPVSSLSPAPAPLKEMVAAYAKLRVCPCDGHPDCKECAAWEKVEQALEVSALSPQPPTEARK